MVLLEFARNSPEIERNHTLRTAADRALFECFVDLDIALQHLGHEFGKLDTALFGGVLIWILLLWCSPRLLAERKFAILSIPPNAKVSVMPSVENVSVARHYLKHLGSISGENIRASRLRNGNDRTRRVLRRKGSSSPRRILHTAVVQQNFLPRGQLLPIRYGYDVSPGGSVRLSILFNEGRNIRSNRRATINNGYVSSFSRFSFVKIEPEGNLSALRVLNRVQLVTGHISLLGSGVGKFDRIVRLNFGVVRLLLCGNSESCEVANLLNGRSSLPFGGLGKIACVVPALDYFVKCNAAHERQDNSEDRDPHGSISSSPSRLFLGGLCFILGAALMKFSFYLAEGPHTFGSRLLYLCCGICAVICIYESINLIFGVIVTQKHLHSYWFS